MGKRKLLIGVGLAMVSAGTFTVLPAGATGGGGPVAQEVLGSGSDTTQFMMSSLDSLYQFSPGCQTIPAPGNAAWYDFSCLSPDPPGTVLSENYEHDQTHEAYFLGSGNGIHQVCNQGTSGVANISFARSSRAPSGDCTGLHFVAYARDGIPMEVFRTFTNDGVDAGACSGKVNCFSQQQLKDIFHLCTITDWHQVDSSIASGTMIDMYTPQSGSGTRGTFDGFLGGKDFSETCIDNMSTTYKNSHIVAENSNVSILANGDEMNAVFPFSFGIWSTQVKGKNGSLLTSIDNVAANSKTIANLTFPYGRYLFNVFCATAGSQCATAPGALATQATVNYVGEEGWICKPGSGTWSSDGGPHTTNPITGNNFQKDIANIIKSFGFVPNPIGTIGGGDSNRDYCRLMTT